MATSGAANAEEAYMQVQSMLGRLGDPYTRIIPPQEAKDFRIGSDGELHGVGLMIAQVGCHGVKRTPEVSALRLTGICKATGLNQPEGGHWMPPGFAVES